MRGLPGRVPANGRTVVGVNGLRDRAGLNGNGRVTAGDGRDRLSLANVDPAQARDRHGWWSRVAGKPVRVHTQRVTVAGNPADEGKTVKVLERQGSGTTVAEDLGSLFDDAAAGRVTDREVPYLIVEPYRGDAIASAVGLDVTRYAHTVDADHVRKLLKKRVGAETDETSEPLTRDEFVRLPEVVGRPDAVERTAGRAKQGQPRVVYHKRLDGNLVVVEELRERGNRLTFVTM